MFFVEVSDGVKVAVYDYNPKGKQTVLLVHGWPLSHKMYEYQINCLLDLGYRVTALDLRGFGASDTPAGGYSYDRMANDIYEVVCALDLKDFILVGFSMGGAIVLRYMNCCRGYGVKKLILLSAAAPSWTRREGFPYGLTREYVDQLICQARTDRAKLAWTFSHKQLFASAQSEQIKDWFQDIAMEASGVGTIKAACSLRDEDGRADLACVNVPTVTIHGAKDTVVSNDLAMIQQKGIKGSKLYNLANSGHGIVYDELEKFNRIFLGAVKGEVPTVS